VAVVLATAGLLRTARVPADVSPRPAPRTLWGEPDLQGIWTDPYQTPLERPTQFAGKEMFTDEERAALDKQRAGLLRRDKRAELGTERDVAAPYNAGFHGVSRTGKRTPRVVDPPDGGIPACTPEESSRTRTENEYRLALLEATETCKTKEPACSGGKYG